MSRPFRRLFQFATSARTARRDVDEELRFHLDARVAELVAGGRPRGEAERIARAEFGDVSEARDELTAMDERRVRREGRSAWWSGWSQDLRYAVRSLRRQPAFAAAVLLTIALGIGANGAIFSATDAALLRPLPYRDPARLVHLWQTSRANPNEKNNSTYPNLLDWRVENRSFTAIAGYHSNRMVLGEGEQPRVVWAGKTTANFFDVLGVKPALGRLFADGEDAAGAPRIVLLSHDLWRREFSADPTVIGRAVRLDGASYTVVGVLPDGFQFARVGAAEVWVPFDRGAETRTWRGSGWFDSIARLRDGVSMAQASADMRTVAASLATRYPDPNDDVTVRLVPLRDELTDRVRPLLLVLLGAAGLVLLVALSNVAGLLLVRGTGRARELAVRASLGAGQGRIVRQLLTESLLLALGGGLLGLGVAHAGVRALVAAIPPQRLVAMPYLAQVGVNGRLVAYMIVLSVIAGAAFGVVPALRVARSRLGELLRQGARGSSQGLGRSRDVLVVAELALTVVLVAGAALFGRSLTRLLALDPGFRAERVFTAFVPLPRAAYAKADAQRTFFLALEAKLRAFPGVVSVGLTTKLPLDPGNSASYHVIGTPDAAPGHSPGTMYRAITPDYFQTLGIPLRRGAVMSGTADTLAQRQIVVSEAFAHEALGTADPIGRLVSIMGREWQIVGIVGDIPIGKLEEPVRPTVYIPFARDPEVSMRFALRLRADQPSIESAVRRAVRELDPQVALYQVAPMQTLLEQSESVFMRRYPLLLVGAFAATALLLAIVGTYGVISYAVAQRSRELGIRVALGASQGSVVGLVARHAAALAGAGVVVGVSAAFGLSRFAASLLYGVTPSDPATYALATAVLGAVAVVAAVVPARRASRVDPARTLRAEG